MSENRRAEKTGELLVSEKEIPWLARMKKQAASLPDREQSLTERMAGSPLAAKFLPEEYGLGQAGLNTQVSVRARAIPLPSARTAQLRHGAHRSSDQAQLLIQRQSGRFRGLGPQEN